MFSQLSPAAVHLGLPNELSRASIQAEHRLRLLPLICRGKVNVIAHHRRRTVSTTGQRRFPQNVFGFTPLHRWVLSGRRDAVARGSTPGGPVRGRVNHSQSTAQRKDETSARAKQCREVRDDGNSPT